MFPRRSIFCFHGQRAGFSLIELLAVVAMISLLVAAAASMGFSDQTSANVRNSLVSLSGQLEIARQVAVTQNTYTYVALTSPSTGERDSYVASFVSPDGVDVLASAASIDVSKDGTLRPLGKVMKLSDIQINPSVLPQGMQLSLPDATAPQEAGSKITGAGSRNFDRIIKFTPQGLALVYDSPVEWIKFLIVPQRGEIATDSEARQASAITVAGLTGKVFYHRP